MPIDYKEYPKNWFTEIRPAVLRRAGEVRGADNKIIIEARCEQCDVENHSVRKGTRIALTIAHLDHDKENHEVNYDRLAAWCQRCHLAYDLPRHMEKARKSREKKKGLQRLFE